MLNSGISSSRININIPLKLFMLVAVCMFITYCTYLDWGGISVPAQTDAISLVSLLVLFVFTCAGMMSERYYWILAPIVIVFLPNAVNHYFPSALMGKGESAPPFSFFTHIDIYLFAGVLAHCDFTRRQPIGRVLFGFFILTSFALILAWSFAAGRGWVTLFGGYQLRYALLMFLLFCFSNPISYRKYFANFLVVALLLTCLEAVVFTYLNGLHRFTSGNYGANTFGALLAAGVVFLLFERLYGLWRYARYPALLLLFVCCVATRTRFALIAMIAGGVLLAVLKKREYKVLVIGAVVGTILIWLYLFYVPEGVSMREGLALVAGHYSDVGAIPLTKQSSSMITRLILWRSAIHMTLDHLWFGVGPGNWSYLKYNYGVHFNDILDMHQDFLNYIVSYGIIIGALFYYCVFVFPLFRIIRNKITSHEYYGWYGLVLVFTVAGLTNAVTWKHEAAALVYYASLIICFGCVRDRFKTSI